MKKKTKEKEMKMANECAVMPEPKCSSIEKVENGFIVKKGYRDKPSIAKTLKEAQEIQAKFLS